MGEVVRFPVQQPDAPPAPERLWREIVGEELHRERASRGERLKDPSSEMLQAIAGALDLSVRRLAVRAGRPDALALAA
jgi:hypothetical protein